MLTRVFSTIVSALMAAGILLAASALPSLGAPTALAPDQQQPITRVNLSQSGIDLAAGTYDLVMAELTFEPGAETALHQHPGPSVGYAEAGRITVAIPGENTTNSFSAGSVIPHPWDRPHIFRNSGDQVFKMLLFEVNPVAPSE